MLGLGLLRVNVPGMRLPAACLHASVVCWLAAVGCWITSHARDALHGLNLEGGPNPKPLEPWARLAIAWVEWEDTDTAPED